MRFRTTLALWIALLGQIACGFSATPARALRAAHDVSLVATQQQGPGDSDYVNGMLSEIFKKLARAAPSTSTRSADGTAWTN